MPQWATSGIAEAAVFRSLCQERLHAGGPGLPCGVISVGCQPTNSTPCVPFGSATSAAQVTYPADCPPDPPRLTSPLICRRTSWPSRDARSIVTGMTGLDSPWGEKRATERREVVSPSLSVSRHTSTVMVQSVQGRSRASTPAPIAHSAKTAASQRQRRLGARASAVPRLEGEPSPEGTDLTARPPPRAQLAARNRSLKDALRALAVVGPAGLEPATSACHLRLRRAVTSRRTLPQSRASHTHSLRKVAPLLCDRPALCVLKMPYEAPHQVWGESALDLPELLIPFLTRRH